MKETKEINISTFVVLGILKGVKFWLRFLGFLET